MACKTFKIHGESLGWAGYGDSWHVLSREVTLASLRIGSPSFIGVPFLNKKMGHIPSR